MPKKHKSKRVVLVGLDSAGKSTIMQRLTMDKNAGQTLPTVGFTVSEVVWKKMALTLFDVGGQQKIRELWPQYCHAADALVIVVDSNDSQRLGELKEELLKLLQGPAQLGGAALLVLANKQDQQHALGPDAVVARLRLHETEMAWHVVGTIGIDGTGLDEGLDWLAGELSRRSARRRSCFLSMCSSSTAAELVLRQVERHDLVRLHGVAERLDVHGANHLL